MAKKPSAAQPTPAPSPSPDWGPQIRRMAITDEVISRFQDLIARGVLTFGSKLPSERELAEVLGVSRPTVRQALKAMQVLGIVRSRQGDGTYLEAPTGDVLRRPLEFSIALKGAVLHDLFETRQTVEIKLAALAAGRRTDRDLDQMREALAGMKRSAGMPDQWCEHELRFHAHVVEAAKNSVMASIVEMLSHLLVQSRKDTVRRLVDYDGSYRTHERVFEAIERADTAGASQAMVEHFEFMQDHLQPLDLTVKN